MKNHSAFIALLLLVLASLGPVNACAAVHAGTVVDAESKKPIEGAFVTMGETVVRTDAEGKFQLEGSGEQLGIRAYGHSRRQLATGTLSPDIPILLAPFTPRALYLSFYGIGSKSLRESALALIKDTEINSLVIDLKGDRGKVAFKSASSLAAAVGAQNIITIKDLPSLADDLHGRGIYAIARIVVFKDDPLATGKPELAVKTAAGKPWRDRENLAWVDPFNKTVWDYNIGLATEAARAGFDEIQFDYVRFPDATGLTFASPNTEKSRVDAISGFLREARKKLIPYNVFLAADIFGYVSWNTNDTYIGQKLESLVEVLDYISPMLYPSGFRFGIPGYLNPVHAPGQVVYRTLEKAQQRTGLPAIRFRPWLQAFRDYAFDRTPFGQEQIRAQIDAAERFGSDGWMLWNPHNTYSRDGLRPKP